MAKEVRAAFKAALFCCVKQTVSLRMVRKLSATSQEITLKALANSSPGFALKPWVQKWRKRFFTTLKELRRVLRLRNRDATPSELRLREMNACSQGCQRNPGLELANAFSVVRKLTVCVTANPFIMRPLAAAGVRRLTKSKAPPTI